MKHSAEILELCFLQMLQVLQKWAINYYKIVHQSSMEKFSNIWMTFHRVWSSYFCLLFPAPPDFKEIIPCEHSWLLTCLVLLMEVWSLVNLLNETTWNSRLLNREKQGNWYLEHLLSFPKKKRNPNDLELPSNFAMKKLKCTKWKENQKQPTYAPWKKTRNGAYKQLWWLQLDWKFSFAKHSSTSLKEWLLGYFSCCCCSIRIILIFLLLFLKFETSTYYHKYRENSK